MELGSPSANYSDKTASPQANFDSTLAGENSMPFAQVTPSETLGEHKDVSILFSDISGYSNLAGSIEYEEMSSLLNKYFEAMGDAVFKYKQTLKQQINSACIGNRILVVFGSPQPLDDHAWCAVQTALDMNQYLAEFNAGREAANKPIVKIGIGINTDKVFSNNLVANRGMDFMAIGAGVHLGYRLEGVCKQYGCNIVISENTYQRCTERVWVRELDSIRVQGNNRAVAVYELLGLRSQSISEQKQKVLDHYYKGREYYLKRKFAIAMGEFATVMEIDSSDKAAAIQLKRCQHWIKSPPPEDWDGAWTLS
ncbi:adenylate/guanylate cyclase domain-containing protein [Microcoleus sp. FACHB-68]|uniref:adenylate/guanylate cyclase domain-containing protein n=1 Tax=Microcoleus sp. FACHB-68 TaxID=2692826 RepID=UPI001F558008|nr:adenylate/guanylate cyclase domain-containing protein [Microcoleus sp. FACHB-68]